VGILIRKGGNAEVSKRCLKKKKDGGPKKKGPNILSTKKRKSKDTQKHGDSIGIKRPNSDLRGVERQTKTSRTLQAGVAIKGGKRKLGEERRRERGGKVCKIVRWGDQMNRPMFGELRQKAKKEKNGIPPNADAQSEKKGGRKGSIKTGKYVDCGKTRS